MFTLKNIVASAIFSTLVSAAPIAGDDTLVKKQSSVPYGTVINSCYIPGDVAITFDDGPYVYTVSQSM
jgi:peptidoglycan/xylan/chitin deacetylase (PgdA/CDA1 family)